MSPQYQEFMTVLGALGRLVVLSIILERALAFVFEHDWFVRYLSKKVPDPQDPTRTKNESRIPGLKGVVALLASYGICAMYRFDVVSQLFGAVQSSQLGVFMTAVVAAGGSAGAIAVFQGFLNMSKESRDALIAAKQAEAEAARVLAETKAKEAAASKARAEAEKAEADSRRQTAEDKVAVAENLKKKAAAGRNP